MGGIELLQARGLWLLAGLVPLVVFYILKIQRRRVKIPSTWLWAAAQRDLMAKQPFKKLVAELPLLLQILALVALAVALARPAMRGGKIEGDHVAIIVDASASMGTATSAGGKSGTRIDEAKRAAVDAIASLEPGADAIVIEAGHEAKVVSPLERDARHLKAAVATIGVREVEGDLVSAVALAADRLRSLGGRRRILVITDGALARPGPLAAAGMTTQIVTVGDAADNVAIVRLDIRSGTDATTHRDQAQVFVMLQNYAERPRDAFVTLSIEGHKDPVASRRILAPANARTPVVLTFEPQRLDEGAGLTVQLSPGDALPIDDVAYGRVPAGHRMPVTLATPGEGSWIGRALDADPNVDLQKVTLAQLSSVNVDPTALVIVEGACPEQPPGQDLMIVAPPPGKPCMGIDVLATTEQPQLTSWESGDARFRFLTLDGVHVAKATPFKVQGAGASLVRAGTLTLAADASIPGRTVTLLGFDVGESDWPLKASFVLFVRNLVEMSKLHRAQGAAGPVKTGDPLRVAVPNGVTSVHVEGPGMPDHELGAKGGFAIVPAIEHAGVYKVRWTTPRIGRLTIAANLTSEKESDVRPKPINVEGSDTVPTSAVRIAEAHNEWGAWLALLAALVLAFDIWWLTRRPKRPSLPLRAAQ